MRRATAALVVGLAIALVAPGVALASDDPDFDAFQYGPQHIYAPEAWTVSRGAGVTIAVVDSGVQVDHPDLRDKMLPGYDFISDDDDPSDESGHGTHVAGIAAAVTDNGIGMAGVAPDSKILPVRALDPEAEYAATALLPVQEGIRFAVDQGAKVINLSIDETILPGTQDIRTLETSCLDAYNAGSLCVIAAGNSGLGKPSGYSEDLFAILVAATDRKDEVAEFSQRADTKWGVAAPGVSIHSTLPDSGFGFKNGTSMAAPHVAGVAALLFAQGLSIDEVIDRILSTAQPLNDGGGTSGAGLVNAAAAVGAAFTPPTTVPGSPGATTTTVAAVTGGGGGGSTAPSGGSTDAATDIGDVDAPVDLEEGVIEEEGELLGVDEGDFETALGETETVGAIELSDGYESTFLLGIAGFVAVLAILGFGARRLVLRRGIGEMKG